MTKPDIPLLSTFSPEYAALLQKRIDLRVEKSGIDADLDELLTARRLNKTSTLNAAAVDRALELLGDEPTPSNKHNEEEYNSLLQRSADLTRALEFLDDRIHSARMNASRTACEKIGPEYKKFQSAVATAMIELHTAVSKQRSYKNAIEAADISFAYLPAFNVSTSFAERLGSLISEAASLGLVSKTVLPVELR